MRLKLTLEYDGTGFRGWAAQPGLRTVEGTLRGALDGVFPGWTELAVAGRTSPHSDTLRAVARASSGRLPPRAWPTSVWAAIAYASSTRARTKNSWRAI